MDRQAVIDVRAEMEVVKRQNQARLKKNPFLNWTFFSFFSIDQFFFWSRLKSSLFYWTFFSSSLISQSCFIGLEVVGHIIGQVEKSSFFIG